MRMEVPPQTPSPTRLPQKVRMLPRIPRLHKLEALRLDPSPQTICALGLPLLDALRIRFLPALLGSKHVRKLLVEVDVDLRVFVPAAQTLVGAFQKLDLLDRDLGCFGGGELFAFVGYGVAEEVLVD